MKLGHLEEIENLRTIWEHEERDFSVWLAKENNLALLSNAIGIPIVLHERESSVGGFSVDLFAYEEGGERKIVIENQLEDTNHDHLGKIITYASGKNAEIVIWLVKRARDEHKKAIEWLNDHMDSISFFLIEIKLWKIGDSLPAPRFDIVEQPNSWAKTMKTDSELTDTKKLQLEFWQAFVDYAFNKDIQPVFSQTFSKRKTQPQHWYNLSIDSSKYHLSLTVNTQKNSIGAEIYIHDDKELFAHFKSFSSELENILGSKIEWIEASKACRLLITENLNIKSNSNQWENAFDWFCDMSVKLKKVAAEYNAVSR